MKGWGLGQSRILFIYSATGIGDHAGTAWGFLTIDGGSLDVQVVCNGDCHGAFLRRSSRRSTARRNSGASCGAANGIRRVYALRIARARERKLQNLLRGDRNGDRRQGVLQSD